MADEIRPNDNFELQPVYHPRHALAPRARSKRPVWRCAAYSCATISLVTVGGLGYFVYPIIRSQFQMALDPHFYSTHTGTADTSSEPLTLVEPLIELDTKFDLVATVLLRQPDDVTIPLQEADIARRTEELRSVRGMTELDIRSHEMREEATARWVGVDVRDVRSYPKEEMLWSGYIARNVTMRDGPVDTSITFDLPLERFRNDPHISRRDLRLGIAVIPQSPSRIDRLKDFDDWRGNVTEQFPKAVDPSILQKLNQGNLVHVVNQTKRMELIDHMVTGYSMLEFHTAPYGCYENGTKTAARPSDLDLQLASASAQLPQPSSDQSQVSPDGKLHYEVMEAPHPYFIERSHFYMVNETRPYRRSIYDMYFNLQAMQSCGQGPGSTTMAPSWRLCHRTYTNNGQWLIRANITSGTPEGEDEAAYGPFISRLKVSAGPKHLTKIPVSRGKCARRPQQPSDHRKSIPVTHYIRFSTISPARLRMFDAMGHPARQPHDASEDATIAVHDSWSQMTGLLGDRQPGTHPWTRLLLFTTRYVLAYPMIAILTTLYWFTRQTATGIFHTATFLQAIGLSVDVISTIAWWTSVQGPFLGLGAFLLKGWTLIPCWYMLALVWSWEFHGTRWFSGWTRTRWTHRERTSMRAGSTISSSLVLALVGTFWAVQYITLKFDVYLIDPIAPSVLRRENHTWHSSDLFLALCTSLQLAGSLLQLEFNRRSRTFAGDYAINARLKAATVLMKLLYFVRPVIGVLIVRKGLSVTNVADTGVSLWAAWQSWTLPRVEQVGRNDEDDE